MKFLMFGIAVNVATAALNAAAWFYAGSWGRRAVLLRPECRVRIYAFGRLGR